MHYKMITKTETFNFMIYQISESGLDDSAVLMYSSDSRNKNTKTSSSQMDDF